MRWPDGFVCPACGHEKGWALAEKHTRVRRLPPQTSVTAGTILHASKLPLTVWFWAAYLMATHSNGTLPCALETAGIGSYRSLGCSDQAARQGRPREPVVGPGGNRPEASLPFRTKDDRKTQPRRQDAPRRRHRGDGNIARPPAGWRNLLLRRRRRTLSKPCRRPDALAKDGWSGYAVPAEPNSCRREDRSPRSCRGSVFSIKGWAYHGARMTQAYLDEFV